MNKEEIVGDLEIRVGNARKALAGKLRAVNLLFDGMSEKDFVAKYGPENVQNMTSYTDWIDATDALELWEFLLNAARGWEPGDNIVPVEQPEE